MTSANAVDNINAITGRNATASEKAQQTLTSNYEDFLKMLTTQLQNQDPTAPTDTNQLTQQIATLSQVEQQISTNKNLEKLIDMYNATQFNSLVDYIGKKIEANGDNGMLAKGSATFSYYLDQDAENVKVTITDMDGHTVYQGAGTKLAGRNEFVWNGKNSQGTAMKDGVYKIKVEAKDAGNNDITSKTYTTGIVTSVDSANGSVYLSIGDMAIPLTNVLSIRQANA